MQRWVNTEEMNCEPTQEAEFHDWYQTVHVPRMFSTAGYCGVKQFEAKEARDGRGRFLSVYDLEAEAVDPALTKSQPITQSDLVTPLWQNVFWRETSEHRASDFQKSSLQRWLMVVEVHAAPSREAEFTEWYDNVHVPDVLKTPGYVAARRYEIRDRHDGRGKYLALYYLDTNDIDESVKGRRAKREIEEQLGRSSTSRKELTIKVWRNVLWKEIYRCANKDNAGGGFFPD